jgi:hypothetical protein
VNNKINQYISTYNILHEYQSDVYIKIIFMKINQDIMSTYILLSNFMKINQDIISTYILISNVMKINQDIIVT